MLETTSATATFLFTDIEGSTQLLKAHRGEYATILAEHHRVLREAFTAYGGKEVDNRPRESRSIERVIVGQSPRSVGHIAASSVSGRTPVREINSIVTNPSVAGLNVPITTVRPADPAIGPSPPDVLSPVFP